LLRILTAAPRDGQNDRAGPHMPPSARRPMSNSVRQLLSAQHRIVELERAIRDAVGMLESGRAWHAKERLRAAVTCGPRPQFDIAPKPASARRRPGAPDGGQAA